MRGGLWAALLVTTAVPLRADPVEVSSTAFTAFEPGSDAEIFGALRFIGGLQLDSRDDRFGGLSGLEISADGRDLLMVTDTGNMIQARLEEEAGRPARLVDVEAWPLVGADGRRLGGKHGSDAEALRRAPDGKRVLVGFERDNRVLSYEASPEGRVTEPRLVPVPDAVRDLPHNQGLEALAVAPPGTPRPGLTVMFGEAERGDGRLHGWVLDAQGRELGTIYAEASDDFSATDAVFTDEGDLILLERRYKPLFGVAMRIRRFAEASIEPGAVLAGDTLITARMNYVVDNMEGIAFHRDEEGRAILTVVSDDNFNILQRNLLLRFEIVD
ncbi:esterase-like activity of phytase family protein [Lutibaculum baratangense]|uniref:Phytase-like domain-containing protein n=1 Tax=Lutibaculum baratangense AMV1 TaxID=631454 RepID=V4QWJ1_9HYPH|nr:esterase-like activity of phytase family protein [Lutibaculum baratangense]ESR24112.1 hypothetical protein N177_2561 [Lutibaculum baratangense AMV1]